MGNKVAKPHNNHTHNTCNACNTHDNVSEEDIKLIHIESIFSENDLEFHKHARRKSFVFPLTDEIRALIGKKVNSN